MSLNDLYNVELWRRASTDLRNARGEANDRNRFANAAHHNRLLKQKLAQVELQVAVLFAHEERFDKNVAINMAVVRDSEPELAELRENGKTAQVLKAFKIYKENASRFEAMLLEIAALEAVIEATAARTQTS